MNKVQLRRSRAHPVKLFVMAVLLLLLSVVAVFFYAATQEEGLPTPGRQPEAAEASPATDDGAKEKPSPESFAAIVVYGQSAADPSRLVPVQVRVPKSSDVRGTILSVIEVLQKPFPDNQALPLVPRGTRVLTVFLDKKDLYLDLSREFVLYHPGGTLESLITLYGVVNSLTRLPAVERVKLLIGGQEAIDYKGHFDLRPFYEFNPRLVLGEYPDDGVGAVPTTSPSTAPGQ